MKKFFNDNLWLFVIAAAAVAGFALWRTYHKTESITVKTEATE